VSAPKSAAALLIAALACALGAALPYAMAAGPPAHEQRSATPVHSPYHSHELWATINVCNPKDAPNVVGVRGSMPGDGESKDMMYMRFRLEYYETSSRKWIELGHGADSGLLPVGTAGSVRQYGRSFTLAAPSHPFELRGVVSFEWLRGKHVVYSTQRSTTAGRKSFAGADPTGFSAATCLIS
jgi:hypothetical protein